MNHLQPLFEDVQLVNMLYFFISAFSCHCSLTFFCAWLRMSPKQTLCVVQGVVHMVAALAWEQSAAQRMRLHWWKVLGLRCGRFLGESHSKEVPYCSQFIPKLILQCSAQRQEKKCREFGNQSSYFRRYCSCCVITSSQKFALSKKSSSDDK